jgi:hypothetical protein
MYITTEKVEIISNIRDFFTYFPHAIPEYIRFYYDELQECCPDLKGKRISQIAKGKKSVAIAIEHLEQNEDIWDFVDYFANDIRGDYDLIDWVDSSLNGIRVTIYNLHFFNKDDYLDMVSKTWKHFKPTQEELIGAIVEKQL